MRLLSSAALVIALAAIPAFAQKPHPSRAELSAMEQGFDQKIRRFSIDTPIEILGMTRGLYLQGYGTVFTCEVNLLQTQGISPFRPQITKEDVARIRAAKLKRIPELKNLMREMLLASAGSIDRLPPEEQVVLGVFLFYNSWEDPSGMPHMITMQAQRKSLIDVSTNRVPRTALDSLIQVREE